eukprot:1177322-Prorocentrum_minimum.AAC.2
MWRHSSASRSSNEPFRLFLSKVREEMITVAAESIAASASAPPPAGGLQRLELAPGDFTVEVEALNDAAAISAISFSSMEAGLQGALTFAVHVRR